MQDLQERFSQALHATAHEWRLAVDRHLKCIGISQVGWFAISIIADASEPLMQNVLAERLGVHAATIVALVNRLEKAGFIERRKYAADRRVRLIALTIKGKQLLKSIKNESTVIHKKLLDKTDRAALLVVTELLDGLKLRISGV